MLEEKLRAGIFISDTGEGEHPQEGLVKTLGDFIYDYNLDILLGPEWLFLPPAKIYSEKEKESIIQSIAMITEGRNTLVIPGSIMWHDDNFFYNTAPIISFGKVLGEYNKRSDCGSSNKSTSRLKTDKLKYYPGRGFGIYPWRDYRIGVEICADHSMLGKHIRREGGPMLDLYFLVSCGKKLIRQHTPIKVGGYGLNSDGSRWMSEVMNRKELPGIKDDYSNNFCKIKPSNMDELHLDLYEITL